MYKRPNDIWSNRNNMIMMMMIMKADTQIYIVCGWIIHRTYCYAMFAKTSKKFLWNKKKLFFLTFGWIMFAFSRSQTEHMSPEKWILKKIKLKIEPKNKATKSVCSKSIKVIKFFHWKKYQRIKERNKMNEKDSRILDKNKNSIFIHWKKPAVNLIYFHHHLTVIMNFKKNEEN